MCGITANGQSPKLYHCLCTAVCGNTSKTLCNREFLFTDFNDSEVKVALYEVHFHGKERQELCNVGQVNFSLVGDQTM